MLFFPFFWVFFLAFFLLFSFFFPPGSLLDTISDSSRLGHIRLTCVCKMLPVGMRLCMLAYAKTLAHTLKGLPRIPHGGQKGAKWTSSGGGLVQGR